MMAGSLQTQPPVEVPSMAGRLTSAERARIEAHRAAGASADEIVGMIGRDRSTVYRELLRGSCGDGSYRAGEA